jgi:endonuclease/exonuclease/phosphatase family metal-dependent hydrolase
VRVLTWNVWGRFGPWQERQTAIGVVLAAAEADIVCLQELAGDEHEPHGHARCLAAPLGLFAASSVGPFFEGRSVANGVLSRWPILHADQVPLPDGEGRPGPRNALVATIDAPFGPVTVVSTHLHHRLDGSTVRQRQTRALAELVAMRRGDPETAFPLILAGDLNATPDSDELRLLNGRAARGDTWSSANPYVSDSAWPGRRLDYVLVSWPRPRPIGNPARARLAGVQPVDGVYASDHYAVVVDLHTA